MSNMYPEHWQQPQPINIPTVYHPPLTLSLLKDQLKEMQRKLEREGTLKKYSTHYRDSVIVLSGLMMGLSETIDDFQEQYGG